MHTHLPLADKVSQTRFAGTIFKIWPDLKFGNSKLKFYRRPTMQLLLFAGVFPAAILHVVSGACPQNFDFAGQYSQADVVFRGRSVSGDSAIAGDLDGSMLISAAYEFRVHSYFKDNTGRRQRQVQVSTGYSQRDPCDYAFLQPGYSSYLIFARGNSSLSVPACGGVIPWACVPRRTRRTLSTQTC